VLYVMETRGTFSGVLSLFVTMDAGSSTPGSSLKGMTAVMVAAGY
jgi:hypothetical protein